MARYDWMTSSSQLPCMSSWFLSASTSSRRDRAVRVSASCSAPMARSVASSSATATLLLARQRLAASRLRARGSGCCCCCCCCCCGCAEVVEELACGCWEGAVPVVVVVVVVAVVVVVGCWLELLLFLLFLSFFLLFVFLLSFLLSLSPGLAAALGAGAIGTCGVVNPGDELFRWLLFSALVLGGALRADDCRLFLLGWASADDDDDCSPRAPDWFGTASLLAARGSILPLLTFLGELGLWLLAGVDVPCTLRLDDSVGRLDADVDAKLESIDQAVLTIGSKLLIPGASGMEELYCGRDVGDTMKLSMPAALADWDVHGPWWKPATPPPPPGPGAAG